MDGHCETQESSFMVPPHPQKMLSLSLNSSGFVSEFNSETDLSQSRVTIESNPNMYNLQSSLLHPNQSNISSDSDIFYSSHQQQNSMVNTYGQAKCLKESFESQSHFSTADQCLSQSFGLNQSNFLYEESCGNKEMTHNSLSSFDSRLFIPNEINDENCPLNQQITNTTATFQQSPSKKVALLPSGQSVHSTVHEEINFPTHRNNFLTENSMIGQFPAYFLVNLVRLTKIVEQKRKKIFILQEMHRETEFGRMSSCSYIPSMEFQKKYALNVVALDSINSCLNENWSQVQQACNEMQHVPNFFRTFDSFLSSSETTEKTSALEISFNPLQSSSPPPPSFTSSKSTRLVSPLPSSKQNSDARCLVEKHLAKRKEDIEESSSVDLIISMMSLLMHLKQPSAGRKKFSDEQQFSEIQPILNVIQNSLCESNKEIFSQIVKGPLKQLQDNIADQFSDASPLPPLPSFVDSDPKSKSSSELSPTLSTHENDFSSYSFISHTNISSSSINQL